MNAYPRAAPEVVAAMEAAATAATRILQAHGITVLGPDDTVAQPGADLEIDTYCDGGHGVYLVWHPGAAVMDPAVAALLAGRLDDPAIAANGRACEAGAARAAAILRASGLDVEPTDDEYRLFGYRVHHQAFSTPADRSDRS